MTETFEADLRQALARGAADVPQTIVDRLRESVLEESDNDPDRGHGVSDEPSG